MGVCVCVCVGGCVWVCVGVCVCVCMRWLGVCEGGVRKETACVCVREVGVLSVCEEVVQVK